MKAIILLAGYATRMYPLTKDRPKALLPLGGKPVIDYIVEQINRLPAVEAIYCTTNSKFYPHFCDWAKTTQTQIPIEVLDDGTCTNETRRGAIGDIHFTITEKDIDDDLLIVAGDNYFTFDLHEIYEFFISSGYDTVAAKQIESIETLRAFAVATLDKNQKVLDLVEKPENPASNIGVYATYLYKRSTVKLFSEYLASGNDPDPPGAFVQWLHKVQDVYAYYINGDCYDIGTIAMYEKIDAKLKSGKLKC